MDSGWAVVLGAVIALAGSAIIPWIREGTEAQRARAEAQKEGLQSAIVELLSVNAEMAVAVVANDDAELRSTYSKRQRATARLLFQVRSLERQAISDLLANTLPTPPRAFGADPGILHIPSSRE
ncbi:hypothetical protein [Microbacterium xylanilyticum]